MRLLQPSHRRHHPTKAGAIKSENNMSLDVTLTRVQRTGVYDANITHNLNEMASEAGIYEALWRPYRLKPNFVDAEDYNAEYEFEKNNPTLAGDIIPLLEKGLADLKARPEHYEKFDSPNGWGTYEHFVPFVEKYLEACKEYPDAQIEVSR